ncbi:hypothetical protein LJK88_00820 [Paenibacillus sp. P26]|nr:hypothetical protein LJK88_00820 [Paenibacillus sp. P26]
MAHRALGLERGLLASAAMAFVGATIEPEAVMMLWVISSLLIVARVRFLCWAYAVGVLGIVQVIVGAFPQLLDRPDVSWILRPLLNVNIPSMLALVAILHLVEAVYVRTQGHRFGTPMFFRSKRGKIVGGYQLQGFWPLALFLIVPVQGAEERRRRGRRSSAASCGREAGRSSASRSRSASPR